MNKFEIKGRLDGLNEYTKVNRSNRYGANKLKRKNQNIVILGIRKYRVKPIHDYPISLSITWYEPNNRRDIDNVTFAVKFILDALVQEGILVDDSRKYVRSINHKVLTDKNDPRIEVEIEGS